MEEQRLTQICKQSLWGYGTGHNPGLVAKP